MSEEIWPLNKKVVALDRLHHIKNKIFLLYYYAHLRHATIAT